MAPFSPITGSQAGLTTMQAARTPLPSDSSKHPQTGKRIL